MNKLAIRWIVLTAVGMPSSAIFWHLLLTGQIAAPVVIAGYMVATLISVVTARPLYRCLTRED